LDKTSRQVAGIKHQYPILDRIGCCQRQCFSEEGLTRCQTVRTGGVGTGESLRKANLATLIGYVDALVRFTVQVSVNGRGVIEDKGESGIGNPGLGATCEGQIGGGFDSVHGFTGRGCTFGFAVVV